MLSWQVGRVKIARIVEMDLPLAHPDWSLGDHDETAAALTRSRLFAEWADQTILVIAPTSPPPPPATSYETAQRSGSRCEDGEATT